MRDAPYLLVLLVAVTAWILTRLTDRLTQTPTLEYSVTRAAWTQADHDNPLLAAPSNVSRETIYKDVAELRNTSHTARFAKLTFFLTLPPSAPGGSRITFAWTHLDRPALPRTRADDKKDRSVEAGCDQNTWAWYPVQEIQPGWSLELICFHTADVTPEIAFNSQGDGAVRLVESDFETWLVSHEICVLLWLLGITVALLVVYIIFIPALPQGQVIPETSTPPRNP